jgi:molybdopterin/thiamine biosynthesis adenylyltransferase
VKPEHAPYRTVGGQVRIGGGLYGIGAEIEDPDGWVWTLVRLADGTRERARIVADVCAAHPGLPEEEAGDALAQLIDAGHMEDAAAPPPDDLSDRERDRYARSLQYYRWTDQTPRSSPWDAQRALKSARVALVGLGGAGGAAALALAACGVGRLHCVDADDVELSNLNRQTLYTEDDIGTPKVDAALTRLRRLNSDITVTGERRWIGSQADFAALLPGHDLLVVCADRPAPIRVWANRACLAAGTPWIDGGYHGALITAGAYAPGRGPCWECLRATENARVGLPVTNGEDLAKALPRAPGHPVTAVTAGLSGHLIAHLAIALLTGTAPITPGTVYGINLMTPGDPLIVHHPRRPDCPACAPAAG